MRPERIKIISGISGFLLLLLVHSGSMAQETVSSTPAYHPVLRAVPDSVVHRLRSEKEFGYANDPSFWSVRKQQQDNESRLFRFLEALSVSPAWKWALYVFLAALIAFVIYQLAAVNHFFVFRRGGKKKDSGGGGAPEPDAGSNEEKLRAALEEKAYRPATRLLYLKTLQLLHDSGKIRLRADTTNQHYLTQMEAQPESGEFRSLTDIYEYVWYGEFQPDQGQFALILDAYTRFINKHSRRI